VNPRLSRDWSSIRWHRRLETHVVAAIALLIAIALGAVLVSTTRVVAARSAVRGSEEIAVARSAFQKVVESRAESAAAQVRLITELPIFRQFLGDEPVARDAETLRTMADTYRGQLGAEFAIVTDRNGKWVAAPGWRDANAPPEPLRSAVSSAVNGRAQSTMMAVRDRLFLVVAEPARFAEETVGSMTVGFPLDDAIARELAQVTHCEVSLVAGTSLVASSIQDAGRGELSRLLETSGGLPADAGATALHHLGPRTFLVGAFPLVSAMSGQAAGRLVLLRDWAATQQFIDEIQRQFLRAGLLVFACALAGGIVFSRRMSRPIQDVAAAAREIAAGGDWSRRVPLRGSAEAMTMAAAFNEMSTNLRHWYEDAQAKSANLEASYERFRSVTESARDAIVSTDDRGAIAFWNRSAQVIFGYEEAEITGKPLTHLIAPDDRQRYLDEFAASRSDRSVGAGRIIEMIGVRQDGGTFPMEWSAWQPGAQAHVTAVIRDITERRQAQEALKQRDQRLQQAQKMEAIGRLAGGVAHDFNNLLTAIIGFGELVRDNLKETDPNRADIVEVLGAADRAASLTRQLLAFSRRQVVTPQVVALDQIVAGTERMLRRLIGEDITLSSRTVPKLGRVRADPGQIEQVLVNLSVNARDAMPDGGELRIELFNADMDARAAAALPGFEPGRYVCLGVTDDGSGIEPALLAHIFEPFFTTKPEGQGTGLGLATVYGIAKQNGGYVEVDSRVGRGTTFRVYFPRIDTGDVVAGAEAGANSIEAALETVLLVEDDDRVRGLLGNVLRKRGYTVLEASRGDQALALASEHTAPIHLLLSDVVMPGMSGRVVAARVTALRPDVRVLMMSGYSDDAVLRSGIEAAKTPFIQKPFSMDALAVKIRETLSGPTAA
jgi:PAS domain S-box-containing protein